MAEAKKTPRKKAAPKRGRPSKFTPERVEAILEALKSGCYVETAAIYGGVSTSLVYQWCDRGRKERERLEIFPDAEPDATEVPFMDFLEEVEKARANAEIRAVMQIQRAASEGTWQAAAWYLERSYPKKWGRTDHTEITGEGGGAIKVDVATDELERKILAIASKRKDEDSA